MNLYLELLKNRDYRKLLAANICGRLGDSVDGLTLAWLTYQVTGSASLSAVAVAANLLPTVILQPLAAPFVEPLPKKLVMSVCDWLRGGLTAGFLLLYLNGLLLPWMMILFPFLVNSVEAFRVPASVAMLPSLVRKEQIPGAVSLNGAVGQIFTIAGSALGGILLLYGAGISLTVDFAMYLLSGTLICLMRREPAEKSEKGEKSEGYWRLLSGGFRYLGRNRLFRLLVAGALLFNSVVSVSSGILTPYIEEVLGQGAGFLSAATAANTAGGFVAACIYPKISEKISGKHQFLYFGFLALPVLYGGMLLSAGLSGIWQTGIWSLGWFVSGWMIGVFSNLINVKMTVGVEKEYLGRAAALFNSAGCAAAPAVSLGVAGLLQATGLVPLTAGCLAVSAALLLWMAGRKDCNLLDEQI